MVTLDELVPQNHLLRKIDATLNFSLIRDLVRHLYCADNGHPALNPSRVCATLAKGFPGAADTEC